MGDGKTGIVRQGSQWGGRIARMFMDVMYFPGMTSRKNYRDKEDQKNESGIFNQIFHK
jgi:hypothetical protein